MSIKITKCNNCKSENIKELNPENRDLIKKPLCEINCKCNNCGHEFIISTCTRYGKNIGIIY